MDPLVSSILNPVFQRVIDAAVKEYKSVRDLKKEIRKLRTMVFMINGLLEDAERKQDEHGAIRAWLKELKQVLFDAEDVFDEIATNEAQLGRDAEDGTTRLLSKVRFKLFSCLRKVDHLSSSRAIAHRVKDINERFDDISKKKEELKLCATDGTSKSVFWRPHTTSQLPPGEAHIIGRDGEMQNIKKLLLSDYFAVGSGATTSGNYKNVHVISVCGMGGLGKTTLVRHVYNDEEVENYFQLRMWVCVSTQFDVKKVTGDIMAAALSKSKKGDIVEDALSKSKKGDIVEDALSKSKKGDIDEDALSKSKKGDIVDDALSNSKKAKELLECSGWDTVQNCLRVQIEGKRFLLVLDDLWDDECTKWDSLCTPLMFGGKGSKIIVTTRIQKVASITKDIFISLEHLSNKDLWSICQKYAFHGHDPVQYTELVFIGRKIVDNLKGSPLAAKVIGQLLNSNMDARHWNNVMKSKTWVSLDYKNSIIPILKLSYDYLPGHLKQCFAYCSLFPEDHEFDKDKLVQLWMAQQFIQIKEGFFHLESMGGEYFDDLVRMSLFEKCKYDYKERYVMHDLIHNLADSVSKDDYLRLEDSKQNETISETIRHVSIASDKFDPAQLCNKYENMRTLLFLRGCKLQLDPHLDSIFMKLQRLRVLGLNGCNIKKLPASIGTLKHLRFLDLSNNNFISELPDSLCNLHNLQVLNLFGCGQIDALPRNMSALINLRHLYANKNPDASYIVSCIEGIGKLTALHELDAFDCARQPMKELADMGMLRQLRITSLEQVKSREEAIQSRLEKKEHLDELTLEWNHPALEAEVVLDGLQPPPHSSLRELTIMNYGGSRSPSWMLDLQSCFLRTLELQNCTNWEVLPPLGQLLCLDSLKISGMERVRRIEAAFMGCHALEGELPQGGFPSLQVLEFDDMEEWEEWEVPRGEDDQVVYFSEAPLPPRQHDHRRRPLFLARLRELTIRKCPKLRQLPPLPPTLTKLDLCEVGLTHLPEWQLPPSPLLPSSSSSPAYSLSSLVIWFCPELTSLADGLLRHPLPNLVKLEIRYCEGLVSLPPDTAFGHLTSLKQLVVSGCPKLAWPSTCESPSVEEEEEEEDTGLPPSLESITIGGVCREVVDQIMLAIVGSRQKLACLTYLWIVGCFSRPPPPTLRRSLPSSLQQLCIFDNDQLDDETLSAWLRGLTSLRELDIINCPAVTSLPRAEVLSHLTALEKLGITSLKALSSFGGGVHCLVSLEVLTIYNCPELLDITTTAAADSSGPSSSSALPSTARSSVGTTSTTRIRRLVIQRSSMQQIKTWLLQCPSLQELRIEYCPQLTGFGNGGDDGGDVGGDLLEAALLNLSGTLKQLYFHSCENLRSLPPRLRRLSSLQSLGIKDCPQIQSLPEAGLPESLRELEIRRCPELEERCKEGVGSDWPLISHIPTRRFGW